MFDYGFGILCATDCFVWLGFGGCVWCFLISAVPVGCVLWESFLVLGFSCQWLFWASGLGGFVVIVEP